MKRRAAIAAFIATLLCAPVLWAVLNSDSFTYSNGTLSGASANWTPYAADPVVASNRIRAAATDQQASALYTATSPGNDQFSQWTVATMAGSADHQQFGYVRADQALGNAYFCLFRNSTVIEIYEETAGDGGVLIGSGSTGAVVATDVMKCQIIGINLTFVKNGSSVATANDPSITSGKPGFGLQTNSGGSGVSENELDDWSGGDVTAAVAGMVARRRN